MGGGGEEVRTAFIFQDACCMHLVTSGASYKERRMSMFGGGTNNTNCLRKAFVKVYYKQIDLKKSKQLQT